MDFFVAGLVVGFVAGVVTFFVGVVFVAGFVGCFVVVGVVLRTGMNGESLFHSLVVFLGSVFVAGFVVGFVAGFVTAAPVESVVGSVGGAVVGSVGGAVVGSVGSVVVGCVGGATVGSVPIWFAFAGAGEVCLELPLVANTITATSTTTLPAVIAIRFGEAISFLMNDGVRISDEPPAHVSGMFDGGVVAVNTLGAANFAATLPA